MTRLFCFMHRVKKWVILLKNWNTGRTEIWPKLLGQNDSISSLTTPREENESFWPKKLSYWRKKSWPKFLGQNDSISLSVHREKRLSHFDLKSWVTGGTIIRLTFITDFIQSNKIQKYSDYTVNQTISDHTS